MAVVPYSSDVLCVHKTRLQLLYTDVQQLKMVQMVSQSQFFRGFYLLYLMHLPICRKMYEILSKISHRRKATAKYIFNAVALILLDFELFVSFFERVYCSTEFRETRHGIT